MNVVFPLWKVMTEFMKVFCGILSTFEKLPRYKKPGFENKLKLLLPFKSKPLNFNTTPFLLLASPFAAYRLTDIMSITPSMLIRTALERLLYGCVLFTK